MPLASTLSATVEGIRARVVRVEANVGPGLPGTHIVGLADAAVKESRERIRTACRNSSLPWPKTKAMVSLSPAHVPKAGSQFDLPIALAVMGSLDPRAQRALSSTFIVGELALDGSLRPVPDVLPMLLAAQELLGEDGGIDRIVVPRANEQQAQLVCRGEIVLADSLAQVWAWLLGEEMLEAASACVPNAERGRQPDFADIAGQGPERRILEIAAAGAHHMLMIGPPGSGKSMLAERLPSILPVLDVEEMVTSTAIHAAAGISGGGLVTHPPFIAPDPSLSKIQLIGGGSGVPRPGAVSQAHNGVLFLDEASEIAPATLDALRIPLEKGEVRLRRSNRDVVFPADFQLILAMNPCPCGKPVHHCRCSGAQRARYARRISGPLRDRLDMVCRTSLDNAVLNPRGAESSADIAQRVAEARDRASHRWRTCEEHTNGALTNARVPGPWLRRHFPAQESAMMLLSSMLARGEVSQRGIDRILKLSWTLADLQGESCPHLGHVAEAVDLRDEQTVPTQYEEVPA
ncbi:YifB family Mg chelatase-like AAA ATPase [Corynebacterium sp. NML130628]|uniref:YifB family Mg chelatase-like AAA ATPase n=1 Tax=Corynebacterium sp. NML130628 TaxID=1906333 RepID=UPI0008FB10D3|nr:YifB family Mg chelatase-like AAA ATPase [Corynebacterium sp. NML130628]OIR45444.1 ATPase [Corynebacterium sp. NML130628]